MGLRVKHPKNTVFILIWFFISQGIPTFGGIDSARPNRANTRLGILIYFNLINIELSKHPWASIEKKEEDITVKPNY